jgi:hypothetical protein
MRATGFESRHRTLLHLQIVALAFLTYLFDRDDVVWRYIKDNPASRLLEHAAFLVSTALIGVGAVLCTRARAGPERGGIGTQNSQPLGELIFAAGLAFLAPLSGAVLLIALESIRLYRLARFDDTGSQRPLTPHPILGRAWGSAIQQEAAKWGMFITMIVFTINLIDRVAEVLAGASVLVWAIVNLPAALRKGVSP